MMRVFSLICSTTFVYARQENYGIDFLIIELSLIDVVDDVDDLVNLVGDFGLCAIDFEATIGIRFGVDTVAIAVGEEGPHVLLVDFLED